MVPRDPLLTHACELKLTLLKLEGPSGNWQDSHSKKVEARNGQSSNSSNKLRETLNMTSAGRTVSGTERTRGKGDVRGPGELVRLRPCQGLCGGVKATEEGGAAGRRRAPSPPQMEDRSRWRWLPRGHRRGASSEELGPSKFEGLGFFCKI